MSGEDKWDTETFRAAVDPKPPLGLLGQWDGEDEDEDVKDSWDDPEEEEDESKENSTPVTKALQVAKNKKKLLEKIEERERKLQEELLMRKLQKEREQMTPEEMHNEKMRQQMLQEEADLEVAKEMLGAESPSPDDLIEECIEKIESAPPPILETKEDFEKYKDDLVKQIGSATKNQNFPDFVENLVQAFCVHLTSMELKKIHTWIGNLQIEKSKLEQGTKSKKKGKGKAKLNITDNDLYDYNEDVYDDFM